MANENRLYAKLTLDFADSHKIAPLSDAAFRAYIRMLLWSRRMLTDGKVPGPMAKVFAKPSVLRELTVNDPLSPSLIIDGDNFWLHDFTEHQSSRAEIEAMTERNRSNGRSGGLAKAKRVASKSVSETPSEIYPETETETETITTQKPVQKPAHDLEAEFADWWTTYPRKQGKADALKAFKAARKSQPLKALMDGAQAYALLNIGEDKSFLKLPGGWLRGERWADEQIVNATKTTTTNQPAMCWQHADYPMPCDKCKRDRQENDF